VDAQVTDLKEGVRRLDDRADLRRGRFGLTPLW
jgi:hypothetical protein